MNDLSIYLVIGVLMFCIGLMAGYLAMTRYYQRRFLTVARECEQADSIAPLITEMERES